MVHKGEVIERAIRRSGMPLTKIAEKLGYSPRHLYNLFLKENLDISLIIRIGKIIHFDFSSQIKEIGEVYANPRAASGMVNDHLEIYQPNGEVTQEEYNKLYSMYLQLLRSYIDLQEKKLNEKS